MSLSAVKKLYDILCDALNDQLDNQDYVLEQHDIDLLCSIKEYDLEELDYYCDDYCFAALILIVCGEEIFYIVMDTLQVKLSSRVFRWIIDYNGELADGRNPLDTGVFGLEEALDVIESYYDSRYFLLYKIESCSEYPTYLHYIIGTEPHGKDRILRALEYRPYTSETFDVRILEDIWDEYYA